MIHIEGGGVFCMALLRVWSWDTDGRLCEAMKHVKNNGMIYSPVNCAKFYQMASIFSGVFFCCCWAHVCVCVHSSALLHTVVDL